MSPLLQWGLHMRSIFSKPIFFSVAALGVIAVVATAGAIGVVDRPAPAGGKITALKPMSGEATAADLTRVAQQTATPPAAPAPAAAPDPLLGDWRMTYLSGGDPAVLKIDKATRGIIGAALTGSLTPQGGKSCPLSGAIFDVVAGMYPDGAKIMTMDIHGMMRVVAACDGRTTTVEAFVANNQGKFYGAGRASFVPPSPAQPTISTIQLNH